MAFEIIVGGGPVGCYLAYKILNAHPDSQVIMFETRRFDRPQVIRIPFDIANDLPDVVKDDMWPDAETRLRIFSPCHAMDQNFWPRPGYAYWPFISISAFQKSMISLLQSDPLYKDRFYFVCYDGKFDLDNWDQSIKRAYPQFNYSIKDSINAIYCTCGISAKTMRAELNLESGKLPENKGHGIYLIYQNNECEQYARNRRMLSTSVFAEHGLTYAATNNRDLDVQLYTYPVGPLAEIFDNIPADFIDSSSYGGEMTMASNAGVWFEKYKNAVLDAAKQVDIKLPEDLSKIQVFYAGRSEYYWDIVATNATFHGYTCPIYFIGDSAGGTDYKSGLSMGRGLLSAKVLSQDATDFQAYWQIILQREFDKGITLSSDPWIQYHYMIKGRQVFFRDKVIIYKDDTQFQDYLKDM